MMSSYKTASSRLPNKFYLKTACDAPRVLLYWYLLFALIFVSLYCGVVFVAEQSSWAVVVMMNSLVLWLIAHRLATVLLFPGSSKMYSRSLETSIAKDMHTHIQNTLTNLTYFLNSPPDEQTRNFQLFTFTVFTCEHLFLELNQSLPKSCPSSSSLHTPQVDEFLRTLSQFCELFPLWKRTPSEHGTALLRHCTVLSSSSAVLMDASRVVESECDSHEEVTSDPALPENMYHRLWRQLTEKATDFYDANFNSFKGLLGFDWARHHLETTRRGECQFLDNPETRTRMELALFPPSSPTLTSRRHVVVLCNPNAVRFEMYALCPSWIDFYRSKGLFVLVWNYRGFGRSNGSPSPQACRSDIQAIVHHLTVTLKFENVAFHGESVGGIAACHAASLDPHYILIADRTFASLEAVAYSIVGKRLGNCLYYLTGSWEANNAQNFLSNGTSHNRLLFQDARDSIVRNEASLKVGLARKICGPFSELKLVSEAIVIQLKPLFEKPRNFFPLEVQRILNLLCAMDGGHGEPFKFPLFTEIERLSNPLLVMHGNHAVLDWLSCVHVFGSVSSVESVLKEVTRIISKDELSRNFPQVIEFVALLQRGLVSPLPEENPLANTLQPLHCGHSGNPEEKDKARILDLLCRAGWFDQTV